MTQVLQLVRRHAVHLLRGAFQVMTYLAGMRLFAPWMDGRDFSSVAWDGFDFAVGACLGAAFLAGGASVLILARRRLREGPACSLVGLFAAVSLNLGLDCLLAGRPAVAPGLAASQVLALLAWWTCCLARPRVQEGHPKGTPDPWALPLAILVLTSIWWCVRATRVEGGSAIVCALAAPIGARILAGSILAIRATAAANRREIEAYRARREPVAATLEA